VDDLKHGEQEQNKKQNGVHILHTVAYRASAYILTNEPMTSGDGQLTDWGVGESVTKEQGHAPPSHLSTQPETNPLGTSRYKK